MSALSIRILGLMIVFSCAMPLLQAQVKTVTRLADHAVRAVSDQAVRQGGQLAGEVGKQVVRQHGDQGLRALRKAGPDAAPLVARSIASNSSRINYTVAEHQVAQHIGSAGVARLRPMGSETMQAASAGPTQAQAWQRVARSTQEAGLSPAQQAQLAQGLRRDPRLFNTILNNPGKAAVLTVAAGLGIAIATNPEAVGQAASDTILGGLAIVVDQFKWLIGALIALLTLAWMAPWLLTRWRQLPSRSQRCSSRQDSDRQHSAATAPSSAALGTRRMRVSLGMVLLAGVAAIVLLPSQYAVYPLLLIAGIMACAILMRWLRPVTRFMPFLLVGVLVSSLSLMACAQDAVPSNTSPSDSTDSLSDNVGPIASHANATAFEVWQMILQAEDTERALLRQLQRDIAAQPPEVGRAWAKANSLRSMVNRSEERTFGPQQAEALLNERQRNAGGELENVLKAHNGAIAYALPWSIALHWTNLEESLKTKGYSGERPLYSMEKNDGRDYGIRAVSAIIISASTGMSFWADVVIFMSAEEFLAHLRADARKRAAQATIADYFSGTAGRWYVNTDRKLRAYQRERRARLQSVIETHNDSAPSYDYDREELDL